MDVVRIDRRPLRVHLEERLRALIIEGDLAPGEKISEKALCDRFAVSRTPLREALRTMAEEGLVDLKPNRGATVTPLTIGDLAEQFPILSALEALACETACRKLAPEGLAKLATLQEEMDACHAQHDLKGYFVVNQAIHAALVDAADNATLAQMIERVSLRVARMRYQANLASDRWAEAVSEHRQILAALQARDSQAAHSLMRKHIDNKAAALIAQFPA
ncbi:MAG: GntR family transcriptional regulator [Pseudomonadota bacterium]